MQEENSQIYSEKKLKSLKIAAVAGKCDQKTNKYSKMTTLLIQLLCNTLKSNQTHPY